MNILFFGTPQFAADILTHLLSQNYPIIGVVTRPDKRRSRSKALLPSPVKEVALKANLPVFQPEKASAPDFVKAAKALNPDLFVVVAYGEIIKKELLDVPKLGALNIHASLLPKYRGASPIQAALLNGEKETGITIIDMHEKMDAGDIRAIESIPVPDDMTCDALEQALIILSQKLIAHVIDHIEIPGTPQDHSKATYVKKFDQSDCRIDWSRPSDVIHDQIRAYSPRPGAWCEVMLDGEKKRLKILRSCVQNTLKGAPGQILRCDKEGLVVSCQTGALSLLEVQLEGKKKIDYKPFVQGLASRTLKFV